MVTFVANQATDMRSLPELALLADYSNLTFPVAVIGDSFTATADNISFDFTGSSFVIVASVPVSGTIEGMAIRLDEQPAYSISGLSLDIGSVNDLFSGGVDAGLTELLSGDDEVIGSGGNDNLRGYGGNDTISGHNGKDDLHGQGGDDTLIGGTGNDRLFGATGADTLIGGGGANKLYGGPGPDAFVFDTIVQLIKADKIKDFQPTIDQIQLDNAYFTEIGADGPLQHAMFHVGRKAHDSNDRIIYNHHNGRLFYDPDGTGSDHKVEFAVLKGHPHLDADNFLVI